MIFLHRRSFGTPYRRCAASQRVAGPLDPGKDTGFRKGGGPGEAGIPRDDENE